MKRLALLVAAVAMIVAMSVTAFAGEWGSKDGKWYYKIENGKYYTGCKKTIDGKTYAFDQDGWMITGFTDESLNPINGTDYNAAFASTFYFDPDGAMHKGWLKVDKTGAPSNYDSYKELWFYYDKDNGKKYACTNGENYVAKTIDGTKYGFDENGVMLEGWGTSTDDKSAYTVDGKALTGWQQLVPSENMSETDHAAGTKRWFYFDAKGVAVKDGCKKVGDNYYLFNEYGVLVTGLKSTSAGSVTSTTYSDWSSVGSSSEDDWLSLIDHNSYSGSNVYYFTLYGRQKGSQTIDFGGVNHTLYFNENGKAYNGIKGNKLYVNGGLVKATDSKYVGAYDAKGNQHLVDSNGTVIGKGRVCEDLGGYWAVNKAGSIGYFTKDKSEATAWAKGTDGNYGSPAFIN